MWIVPFVYRNSLYSLSLQYAGYRTTPILFVNGARIPHRLAVQARPNQTLLSFVRDVLQLKGSKLGCAEGGCGACTVMLSKKQGNSATLQYVLDRKREEESLRFVFGFHHLTLYASILSFLLFLY